MSENNGTGEETIGGRVAKVLVADDHAVFREGLCLLMQARGFADTVLEAEDAERASTVAEGHPDLDLVVLDLYMPGMENFAFLRALRAERPDLAVVVLSASEKRQDVRAAMDAGATGFIPKAFSIAEVLDVLRRIVAGETIFAAPTEAEGSGPDDDRPDLSPRQREVLTLIAQGYSNKEIARKLDTALPTIKNHVANIFEKLGAANRVAAVNIGRRRGLIPDQ